MSTQVIDLFPTPFMRVGGAGIDQMQIRVPIDDTTTWKLFYSNHAPTGGEWEPQDRPVFYEYLWRDEQGRFITDYIEGQDIMAWVSQGPVTDRTQEHLGRSDAGVAMLRKMFKENMKRVAEGKDPIAITREKHDIINAEKMRTVVRTQIDLVLPSGAAVLNAEDEGVVSLAELSDGEVLYYAHDETHPVLQAHLAAGGRGAFVRQGQLTLARGSQAHALEALDHPHLAQLQAGGLSPASLLAACAAAWSLDIAPDLIAVGLKNFGHQPTPTGKTQG